MNNKLIVILGATASGKTDLAIKLAKKFGGEIISADSRQVYRGLNIGSGKITKSQMMGIPHHLLDVASPKRKFTVAQYQKLAKKAIKKIQQDDKIPFLVGGTGFYIQSVVDGLVLPAVKPNYKLRKKLEKKSVKELHNILKKLDPSRAEIIDSKNPRRLIRAIEIVKAMPMAKPSSTLDKVGAKKPIPKTSLQTPVCKDVFDVLQIGIKKSHDELKKLIKEAQEKRFKRGLIDEVKRLRKKGLSWKRLEELGLEYRYVAQYLQNKISYKEMVNILEKEIWHFASRQRTWFKRDKRIHWARPHTKSGFKEVVKLCESFLSK